MLQSLTVLLVATGSVTVVRNTCMLCRSDCFSLFMFGLKANKYWLCFALYTCTLRVKQALSLLQTLLVEFRWRGFSYLKCQSACWNRCLFSLNNQGGGGGHLQKGSLAHSCKMDGLGGDVSCTEFLWKSRDPVDSGGFHTWIRLSKIGIPHCCFWAHAAWRLKWSCHWRSPSG